MWKQQKAIEGAVYNSMMLVLLTYMYLIQILPPPWLVDIFHNCGGGGLFFYYYKYFQVSGSDLLWRLWQLFATRVRVLHSPDLFCHQLSSFRRRLTGLSPTRYNFRENWGLDILSDQPLNQSLEPYPVSIIPWQVDSRPSCDSILSECTVFIFYPRCSWEIQQVFQLDALSN